jgi:hypothetical protein
MDLVYPKHIYDPIRREIAESYIQHELRKYLPSIKDESVWKTIDADVTTWFDQSPLLFPVRDFWNGFHGILMGFKLKNQLLSFITAENVYWQKQEIELNKLTLGSSFSFFSEAGIKSNEVSEIMAVYENSELLRAKHLAEVNNYFSVSVAREMAPIIVTQKLIEGKDKLVVYDGNGRTVLAVLQGRKKISGYVSTFVVHDGLPKNYWLPTSVLMEITHYARLAYSNKDLSLYNNFVNVLKGMLSFSESGRYEMRERVIPVKSEFRDKIMRDLGLRDI